jgi:peptidylprolyl isomerase
MRQLPLPAALALLLLTGAGEPPVVAQRGDIRLSAHDIRVLLERADPAQRAKIEETPQSLANFVRERLLDMAMLAEARAKGWEQRPEVVQRINDARDAAIVQSYVASLVPADPNFPSEADIAAAYEANKARFAVPRVYRLAQIVIAAASDEEARKKAVAVRALAVKPKADFADLAKKESQEKASADKGGDLGWLREDALLPAVRDAVAGLPEGGTTEPIKLPDGYHLIRLVETKPAGTAPLADVKPQLVQALRQARAQQAVRARVDELLREDPIQLNEIDLARQVSASR